MLLSMALAALAWNFFLFPSNHPTFGTGLFLLTLGGLAAANGPRSGRTSLRWAFLSMLAASALQSAISFSFSCFVSMLVLVALLAWEGRPEPAERWLRVTEGILSLFRPFANGLTLANSRKPRLLGKPTLRGFLAFLTALWLFVLFALLLAKGNAVLAQVAGDFSRWLQALSWMPDFLQILGWLAAAYLVVALAFPPGATFVSRLLARPWPKFGASDEELRHKQCVWSLAGLNLLFLCNNLVDLVYLWGSHTLPKGVTYSEYVHSGVNTLIFTTVLSAGLMAFLAQNPDPVARSSRVRLLNWFWMGQNAFLVLGVVKRLAMYVGEYGYTPKRIYVGLFVCLVLGGYVLLARAFAGDRGLRWLVKSNLALLMVYFFLVQFVNGEAISARMNLGLLRHGKVSLHGLVQQNGEFLDSGEVFVLATVATNPAYPIAARVEADSILQSYSPTCFYLEGNPLDRDHWQEFQFADSANYEPYFRYLSGDYKAPPKIVGPLPAPGAADQKKASAR